MMAIMEHGTRRDTSTSSQEQRRYGAKCEVTNADSEVNGDAPCGSSASWRIMNEETQSPPRAGKKDTTTATSFDTNTSEHDSQPPLPDSSYVTPNPQPAGPLVTPTVPRPRPMRGEGGEAGPYTYHPSPDTARNLRTLVPAPPLTHKSPPDDAASGDINTNNGNGPELPRIIRARIEASFAARLLQICCISSSSSSSSSTDREWSWQCIMRAAGDKQKHNPRHRAPPLLSAPPYPNPKDLHVSDSLEDELLDAAATDVAGICSSEVREHARRKSDDDTNPTGAHDSLENLMEHVSLGKHRHDGEEEEEERSERGRRNIAS